MLKHVLVVKYSTTQAPCLILHPAKNAKINKKLRIVDLQLKKATLDARLAREAAARGEDTEDGDGHAVDRNQLPMEILGRNSNEK